MFSPRGFHGFIPIAALLIIVTACYLNFRTSSQLPPDGYRGRSRVLESAVAAVAAVAPSHFSYRHPITRTPSWNRSSTSPPSKSPTPSPSPAIVIPTAEEIIIANGPRPPTPLSEILLIVKTGASTIWRRMPLHLTTTLANNRIPNSVIYSDLPEKLTHDIESVDVLANVSHILLNCDTLASSYYHELRAPGHINTYREHARLPGDEPPDKEIGKPPGWVLDKYKFLPMLTHAQQNWPDMRWYIYIEDDTFIFMDNLLQWLSTLSPDGKPAYYGAFSGEGKATFAHGGSGIVFSRSLMSTIFNGTDIPDLYRYGSYSANECCGDMILGHVLRNRDVLVNQGEYGPASFRPEPPWKTAFDDVIWCSPVFSFHRLHQRDLMELAELERIHNETSPASRPIIFRDIFMALISPHLNNSRTNWDNFASKYILTIDSTGTLPHHMIPPNSTTVFTKAFSSPDACRIACLTISTCLSWLHHVSPSKCSLDTVVRLGRELDPLPTNSDVRGVTSGWILERIETGLAMNKCSAIKPAYKFPY